MVSLKDIAKECGVSTATVSKALNGQHDIGEETKARVRETAERMGYFPNAAARALKTNRSYNVGVLFQEEAGSGLTHEYFSGVLNGIKVQVEKMGYDVTFINNSYGVKKTSFFEHCRYRNFEGIVIVCADFASQGVLELMNSAFPVVTIDYTHYNCTAVCSNNVKGMEDLLKYIYKKGHRKIAYIHGQKNSNVTRERLTSFYRTMEELHIKVNECPEQILMNQAHRLPGEIECFRQQQQIRSHKSDHCHIHGNVRSFTHGNAYIGTSQSL